MMMIHTYKIQCNKITKKFRILGSYGGDNWLVFQDDISEKKIAELEIVKLKQEETENSWEDV